jgi:pimeloyl-ACP methyl ester carboxylesterase
VVALSGGPGQAATADASLFAEALAPVLRDRLLVLFDARGTGRSGQLTCRSAARLRDARTEAQVDREVRACAAQIGPRRAHYTTADSVEDLEAVRRLLGAETMSLYGVSYGTKLAVAYADRYPDRVERVVSDSSVLPEGIDPFARASFAAIPGVLTDLCADGRCRGITADPVGDLAKLADRLRRGALRGPFVRPDGSVGRARLRQADLIGILLAGDLDPLLRARTPAAVRSALAGDLAPILRLAQSASEDEGGGVNEALFVAEVCEEEPVPWDPAAPPKARRAQWLAAARALPPGSFGPFGPTTARIVSPQYDFCSGWPGPEVRGAPAPPSAVPILVMSGRGDVRTPLPDARTLAASHPGARLLEVGGSGHGVLLNDGTGCARRALVRFFLDRELPSCADGEPLVPPEDRPPARLRDVPVAAGLRGLRGRVMKSAILTLDDVFTTIAVRIFTTEGDTVRGTGLRGGRFAMRDGEVRLTRVVHVPGVRISGSLGDVLHVAAPGMSGALALTRDGRLVGTLGGKRVESRDVTLAGVLALDAPGSPDALRRGRIAARAARVAGRLRPAPGPGVTAP